MQRLITFLAKPFQEKGIILGTLDTVLKAVVAIIWIYLTYILSILLLDSLLTDYNPLDKIWWFSYCFSLFFGGTWLAYIVFFVRDYNGD